MVLYVVKYDLRPERADEYLNIWVPSAIERIRTIPGLVEFRGYRPFAGSHQIAVTYEFTDMKAIAEAQSSGVLQQIMDEGRAYMTNVRSELWAPSPVAPAPIRP